MTQRQKDPSQPPPRAILPKILNNKKTIGREFKSSKGRMVTQTETSSILRGSEIRVDVQNAQVMTDLSQLSIGERSTMMNKNDILYQYGGAAGILLRSNFERDLGRIDQQRLAEGAIKSLLESSQLNDHTDVLLDKASQSRQEVQVGSGLVAEPWSFPLKEVATPVETSLSKIPFRNTSIVSKIMSSSSGDSDSQNDAVQLSQETSPSHRKTHSPAHTSHRVDEDGQVNIGETTEEVKNTAGRASSAIVIKTGDRHDSSRNWCMTGDSQDKILIQRQQHDDEQIYIEKVAAELRLSDRKLKKTK